MTQLRAWRKASQLRTKHTVLLRQSVFCPHLMCLIVSAGPGYCSLFRQKKGMCSTKDGWNTSSLKSTLNVTSLPPYPLMFTRHSIRVIRQTLDELATSAEVVPSSHILRVKLPGLLPRGAESVEISTVYFRAGYTPRDYPTATQYQTRYVLESSVAIKCPSVQLQLAGGKKVQETLTQGDIASRYCQGNCLEDLRSSWMSMWGLDANGDEGVRKAREQAQKLVLKPQREGGGNNVYKEDIPAFLDTLPASEREAWIAMELIETPDLANYLVRAGSEVVKTEVVSELGVFGYALFGPGRPIEEKEVGWLLRTKGKESNEGGVAAGFSVLDSLVLVD